MSPEFASRHWYRLSPLSLTLLPLGIVFYLLSAARRVLYRTRVLRSIKLPVPVVVVGNLTAGGTGKTPLVLWLAEELRRQGRTPGIVSRGHGGSSILPRQVLPEDDARVVGDEPLLLARRGAGPVWIGRDRAAAATALLAAQPACDVIICDDGLQHYRLRRDIEIAVEDDRGHGNGLPLPAGPLREPAGRRVDATVKNRDAPGESGTAFAGERATAGAGDGATSRQTFAPARGLAREFSMQLVPVGLYFVHDPQRTLKPADLEGKRVHAVAGIGNPQRFFGLLAGLGIDAVCHAFPDHHPFAAAELEYPGCDLVLMTEKDAVRCVRFGRTDLVALRVEAMPEAGFAKFISGTFHGLAPA